jgi:hypothetical protein
LVYLGFQSILQEDVIADFRDPEQDMVYYKQLMWLFLEDHAVDQISTSHDDTQWGMMPFCRDNHGEYVGVILAPVEDTVREAFYAPGVCKDTEFRFLFNFVNGQVLQLFSRVAGITNPMLVMGSKLSEIRWDDIYHIYSRDPYR